jgi:hypothetical protein
MKLLWTVLFTVGCTASEGPATSEVESAAITTQDRDYNDRDYNDRDYNSSSYGGNASSGTVDGVEYRVTVSGTKLYVSRKQPDGSWERRTTDQICQCADGPAAPRCTACTTVDLATVTLTASDGTVENAMLRIGDDAQDMNAVKRDTSYAMHDLDDRAGTSTSTCTRAAQGQHITHPDGSTSTCTNPLGCRQNCDLWHYDVQVVDRPAGEEGFCSGNRPAYALNGIWSATGELTAQPGFTFACTGGGVAKCVRWGYRPFGDARRSNNTYVPLAGYHQSCVRAAVADYCANGYSFTYAGTMVDIYDYSQGASLVPSTRTTHANVTALAWESEFDNLGARFLEFTRYHDEGNGYFANGGVPQVGTIGDVCGDRFSYSEPEDCPDGSICGQSAAYVREDAYQSPAQGPSIFIATPRACAHSEQTRGRWLTVGCNSCVRVVDNALQPPGGGWSHCTDPDSPKGWDQECVDKANQLCTGTDINFAPAKMAKHSECTTGTGLYKWDSACTLTVCSDPAYAGCCDSSQSVIFPNKKWNAACVARANAVCTGGLEGYINFPVPGGFCGTTMQSHL